MSDRGDWDHWDFGDSGDDGWDDPGDADPVPVDDGRWGADEPPEDADDEVREGPPRGALLAALGVMLVLAVAIAVVVLRGDDDDGDDRRGESASEVETDDEPSTTRTSRTSSTTTTSVAGTDPGDDVEVDAGQDDGATTSTTARRGGGATATTRAPTTSSTTPDDGKEPGCASAPGDPVQPVEGGFPNDPLRLSICIDDVTPAVGQRVTVFLRADDPDAPIVDGPCGWRIYFERPAAHDSCYDGLPRTGPVEQVPGRVVVQRTHVYDSPGPRQLLGVAESSQGTAETGPYANSAFAVLHITVRG